MVLEAISDGSRLRKDREETLFYSVGALKAKNDPMV